MAAGAAAVYSSKPTTRDEALAILRVAGLEKGRWIKVHEWQSEGRHPSCSALTRAFGGRWGQAWLAAGFDVPNRWASARARQRWTRQGAVDAIRSQVGDGPITSHQLDRGGLLPRRATIVRLFGTLDAALAEAGVASGRPVRFRQDAVLEAISYLAGHLGHQPTAREWDAWDGRLCSSARASSLFHGWSSAVAQALRGLPLPSRRALDRPPRPVQDLLSKDLATFAWLSPRESEAMALLKEGWSLREVGGRLGVSGERVRQIALRAAKHGASGPSRKRDLVRQR